METRSWRPPAITTGLVPFYLILHFLNVTEKLKLTPDALFHVDLNRLSFYPLVFYNTLHLFFGILIFTPLCAQFELSNGTVRTGVVLNVTAFIVGVIYNVIVRLSGGYLGSTEFCGTSSWVLAFSAFLSICNWSIPVIPVKSYILSVPAWVLPLMAYAAFTFTVPSYWLVHLLALLMGYGLGIGHLGFLVDGTARPVAWIESKIEKGINGLRYIVTFIGELEARELRRANFHGRRGSIRATSDEIPLPVASLTGPAA